MGGDNKELRYALNSQESSRFRRTLSDAIKYAYILKQHLNGGGSLEDL